MSSADLTPAEAAVVTVGVADLRREPDPKSELVSQLLFGETVEVRSGSEDGRWLAVTLGDGYAGWLRAWSAAGDSRAAIDDWCARATLRVLRPWLWRGGEDPGPLPFGARLAATPDGGLAGPRGPVILRPSDRRAVGPAPCPVEPERPARRSALVRTARRFLGVPYLWGGRSPAGFDCSGFLQIVYQAEGISLPRDARDQCRVLGGPGALRPVRGLPRPVLSIGPAALPAAGDLLFFGRPRSEVTHVALSTGGLGLLHAFGRVAPASLEAGSPAFETELLDSFLGWAAAPLGGVSA